MKKFPARLTFYLLNLLAAILLVCVIGYFVLSHLESYTQHGQFIPVPAFNDLTVEEAHAVARHAPLVSKLPGMIFFPSCLRSNTRL